MRVVAYILLLVIIVVVDDWDQLLTCGDGVEDVLCCCDLYRLAWLRGVV